MFTEVLTGNQQADTVNFTMVECCNCGVPFLMPSQMQRQLVKNGNEFYCPNGHSQTYGKSLVDKLKEKLQQEEEKHAKELYEARDKMFEAISNKNKAERKLSKADKQIKRIHKGVCPCCNRSFINLKRHMETKHPEVVK